MVYIFWIKWIHCKFYQYLIAGDIPKCTNTGSNNAWLQSTSFLVNDFAFPILANLPIAASWQMSPSLFHTLTTSATSLNVGSPTSAPIFFKGVEWHSRLLKPKRLPRVLIPSNLKHLKLLCDALNRSIWPLHPTHPITLVPIGHWRVPRIEIDIEILVGAQPHPKINCSAWLATYCWRNYWGLPK